MRETLRMTPSPGAEQQHSTISLSQHPDSQDAWQFLRKQLHDLKPSLRRELTPLQKQKIKGALSLEGTG